MATQIEEESSGGQVHQQAETEDEQAQRAGHQRGGLEDEIQKEVGFPELGERRVAAEENTTFGGSARGQADFRSQSGTARLRMMMGLDWKR